MDFSDCNIFYMAEIYQPAEDSYLMSETLKLEIPKLLNENPNLKFLEVGIGNGINLQTAEESGINKKNIFGCDVNKKAVEYCKKLGYNCINSNLFTKVKGRFDVIVFNPPYLPHDKDEPKSSRIATTGGKKGNEIIVRFLKQVKNHLNKEGIMFLITSSLSNDINFKKFGYNYKKIGNKKLFFEELSLWKLRFN